MTAGLNNLTDLCSNVYTYKIVYCLYPKYCHCLYLINTYVYTYAIINVYTYFREANTMNKRSDNMKKVNSLRSDVTFAMLYLLDDLENGTGGDYYGFTEWDIKDHQELKGQLNSYRAQKIAQFLGRTISKQKLLKYAKPKGYTYSLTNQDITQWLEDNKVGLLRYSAFNIGVLTEGQRSK